ncbi:MAG TPA: SGNH/GDSL hydrolase family protein [Stellaceae bacterium]
MARFAHLASRFRGLGGQRHRPSVDRQAPLSHRFSFRLQNSHYVNWPVHRQTLTTLLHLEAQPCRVRLIYFNDQNTPWTVDGAALALSAAVGDGHTPVNAVGVADPSLWRRVTFNNGGLDVDPLAQVGGEAYALTLPVNPQGSERPVFAFSDWMPVAPLARRGRGFGSLLLVRTYSDEFVRISSGGSPHKAIGRLHAGFCADGNLTIPPWMAPQTRTVGAFAVHGVQYISPSVGATVVGIGDSIMTSSCTTGQTSGFGIRACALVSTPQLPVSYFNEGYPGRNSIGFCSCGIWDIEHLKPQAALIQTWSGNEPWTRDMADLSFARAMSVADTARRNHCVPILVTPAPVFGTNPEAEAHRQRNLTRARAAAPHCGYLLDLDALWGSGVTPNTYRREYDWGDQMHPNDKACAAAARALAPMLRQILGRA